MAQSVVGTVHPLLSDPQVEQDGDLGRVEDGLPIGVLSTQKDVGPLVATEELGEQRVQRAEPPLDVGLVRGLRGAAMVTEMPSISQPLRKVEEA